MFRGSGDGDAVAADWSPPQFLQREKQHRGPGTTREKFAANQFAATRACGDFECLSFVSTRAPVGSINRARQVS